MSRRRRPRRPSQAPIEVASSAQAASFQLALAAVPAGAVQVFHHVGLAGFVTAVAMLAALALQVAAPALIDALGTHRVMAAGGLLLAAAGAVGWTATRLDGAPAIATVCVAQTVRGAGFGLMTVASSLALVTSRPYDEVGRALARYTLVTGWPGLVGPSLGLAILAAGSPAAVELSTAGCGVLSLAALAGGAAPEAAPIRARAPRSRRVRSPGVWVMACAFTLVSGTWAGVAAFLPAALEDHTAAWGAGLMLLFGLVRFAARWWSGHWHPAAGGLTVLAAAAAAGLLGPIAVAADVGLVAVVLGGGLYAFANGIFHTVVFRAMLGGGAPGERDGITAMWNSSIEVGGLVAGAGLGALASIGGTSAAFWGMAAMLAGTAVALAVARRTVPAVSLRPRAAPPVRPTAGDPWVAEAAGDTRS